MSTRPTSGASLGLTPIPGDEHEAAEALTAFDHPQHDRYIDGALIGRGGMGEIRTTYDARLGRTVALKTPVDRDGVAARHLVAEATLTARLVHPGIVAVHDAGRTTDGRPYYTMPIVHGRSLAEAIEQTPPPERLRLVRHFLDACEAIAYAHGQGVLHRDLKPSNILVGRFGETVVVDWGLAGAAGERPPGVVGTPGYMPPEQARGEALDPAADVFALGVTLREILTGSPLGAPLAQTPPELMAIVEQATQRAPRARYPDGHALALDVAAWFEGRRVAAHRYSARELVARAWATHRVPLLFALLAVVGIATASTVGYLRTAAQRAHAVASEAEAVAARDRAEHNLARAEIAQALDAVAQNAWPQAELLAADALRHEPSPTARGVLARFDPEARPQLLRRYAMPPCSRLAVSGRGGLVACARKNEIRLGPPGTPWDAMRPLTARGDPLALVGPGQSLVVDHAVRGLQLVGLQRPASEYSLHTVTSGPKFVLPSADGSIGWVAGTSENWWDPTTHRREVTTWCEDEGRSIPGVAGRRLDGLRLAVCQDGGVWMMPAGGSRPRSLTRLPTALGGPLALAFSTPGSPLAAVGTTSGRVVVLDLDAGRVVRTLAGEAGTSYDLALTDTRLAQSDGRDSVFVWEVSNGALVVRLPARRARVRWVNDGTHLRVVGDHLEEWALPATRARPHVRTTGSGIAALAVSPDGQTMLSAHGDGLVRLSRLDEQEPLAELPLHWSVAKDVQFSPDGRRAAVASAQAEFLFVIDLQQLLVVDRWPSVTGRRVAWLRDDELLLGAYQGGLERWHAGEPTTPLLEGIGVRVSDMESDPDRRGATLLDTQGRIFHVDAQAGPQLVAHRPDAHAVVGHADVTFLVTTSTLEALDREGRTRSVAISGPAVIEMALSADGQLLALGCIDGRVWIRATDSLKPLAVLRGHASRVSALAFDPAGAWLLSGSWDGDIRQWSLGALRTPAETLLAEAEQAWGLPLPTLLEAGASDQR